MRLKEEHIASTIFMKPEQELELLKPARAGRPEKSGQKGRHGYF
jgi:hypothetical protein